MVEGREKKNPSCPAMHMVLEMLAELGGMRVDRVLLLFLHPA